MYVMHIHKHNIFTVYSRYYKGALVFLKIGSLHSKTKYDMWPNEYDDDDDNNNTQVITRKFKLSRRSMI